MESLLGLSKRLPLLLHKCPKNVQCQSIRWRKPAWVGVRPSKLFKVKRERKLPENQDLELEHLLSKYELFNKSLWSFQKKIYDESQAVTFSEEKYLQDEEEYEKILEENELENKKVWERREVERAKEWKKMEEDIIAQKLKKEEEAEAAVRAAEEKLESELQRLESIVTREDLDTYIEKVLANEVDYNFAIDKMGNRFEGRYNNYTPTIK